jgi:hypothetical protein
MFEFRRAIFVVSSLLMIFSSSAHADNECDSVLKTTGLETVSINSSDRRSTSFAFACSHDFQEFNDRYGASASGYYAAIGGSGSYSQGNYKKYQQDHCTSGSSSAYLSLYQFSTIKDNEDVLNKWSECMVNQRPFSCRAEPGLDNTIKLIMKLNFGTPYKVDSVFLSDNGTLAPSTAIMKGDPILNGERGVVISRKQPNRGIEQHMISFLDAICFYYSPAS